MDGGTGEVEMSRDAWLGPPHKSMEVGWAGGAELSPD